MNEIRQFYKKWRMQILTAIAAFFLCASSYSFLTAGEKSAKPVLHVPTLPSDDELEVLSTFTEKYEELNWFVSKSCERKYEKKAKDSPSLLMFGKFYPQFDRSIMMLQTMHLFSDGKYEDYLEFTSNQPKENRLTWDQFKDLQEHAKTMCAHDPHLSAQEVAELVEFALVISEMGKSDIARNKAWIYEITEEDDIEFVKVVLEKHPEIFPSYAKLSDKLKPLVKNLIEPLPFEKLFYLEGGSEMLSGIETESLYSKNPALLDYGIYVSMCRFAGKYGEISPKSSSIFTASLFRSISYIRFAALETLEKGKDTAFDHYLTRRARSLGYDPGSPLNRVLTKLGVALSLYKPSDGKLLKEAFLKLGPEDLSSVLANCAEQLESKRKIAVESFAEFLYASAEKSTLGKCERDRLFTTIGHVLPFYAKVVKEYRRILESSSSKEKRPLNFSEVVPKEAYDPSCLNDQKFGVDEKGRVYFL